MSYIHVVVHMHLRYYKKLYVNYKLIKKHCCSDCVMLCSYIKLAASNNPINLVCTKLHNH